MLLLETIKPYLYLLFISCIGTVSTIILSVPFTYYAFDVEFVYCIIPYPILTILSVSGLRWSTNKFTRILNTNYV